MLLSCSSQGPWRVAMRDAGLGWDQQHADSSFRCLPVACGGCMGCAACSRQWKKEPVCCCHCPQPSPAPYSAAQLWGFPHPDSSGDSSMVGRFLLCMKLLPAQPPVFFVGPKASSHTLPHGLRDGVPSPCFSTSWIYPCLKAGKTGIIPPWIDNCLFFLTLSEIPLL